MEHLSQKFTVHPVGQGLFYSGMVNVKSDSHQHNAPSFNFVFDCGSLNIANADEEVDLYRHRHLPDSTDLDLLVISHFDADHVSHIERLLDKKKVKRVVLPFATLEERLFLVLKHYNFISGTTKPWDAFTVRFILDPIGSLGENLDGDSVIYIVNGGGPSTPFDIPGDGNTNESDTVGNDNTSLVFDIPGARPAELKSIPFPNGGIAKRLKTVEDSKKGFLTFGGNHITVMEFLFYRKSAGEDSLSFFEALYREFCHSFRLDHQDKSSTAINALIEKVKEIKKATTIKELFRKVKKDFPTLFIPGRDIANLNTTALCMLHHNLPAIYVSNNRWNWIEERVGIIKKFDGTDYTRVEEPKSGAYPHGYDWHPDHPRVRFPNCLLTSDNFLKTKDEVSDLYQKYQNYWERFWLFQVPHHGATSSAGLELLSRLPHRLTKFINYGTTHRFIRKWQHPSPQLINDLVASGQSNDVLPVNEFSGFVFGVNFLD